MDALGKHPMQAAIEGDVWVRWTARLRQWLPGWLPAKVTTPNG